MGANRAVAVTDPEGQALRLLRSHATSAGPLRSPERVRAMLLVRLNQLASGGNGIDPAIVSGLVAMLQADALPPVRELGGIGTGDLSALGTTALSLLGELATSQPFAQTVRFGPGDGLTFMSSNAATLADTFLALDDLDRLDQAVTGRRRLRLSRPFGATPRRSPLPSRPQLRSTAPAGCADRCAR